MEPKITIMKPKRGPRFNVASVTDSLKIVRDIHVTNPDLIATTIRRFGPPTARTTADGKREACIPSMVVPMDSTTAVEFNQTVTSTESPRPVLNVDVWRGFYDILYRGYEPNLKQKHAVYISPLRDGHGILVVPAEHEHAADVIWAHRNQLVLHQEKPFCLEMRTLTGDGNWRKSRTLMSSTLFSMVFHGTDIDSSEFFVPEGTERAPTTPGSTPTSGAVTPTVTGVPRPRQVADESDESDESDEARSVRPRHTLGGGKGLMGQSASTSVDRIPRTRGMTKEAQNTMRLTSLMGTLMRDRVSDINDVVFAQSAITTIRSHVDDVSFVDFVNKLSVDSEGVPIVASRAPSEAVAGRVVDLAKDYGHQVVDALNMLSDHM